MKRILFCFFSIIACYLLQVTVFPHLQIADIKPNLMIIMTSIIGFTMGSKPGIYTGFCAGLLVDIMSGGSVGYSALVFMYLGFLNGLFYKDYIKEELYIPLGTVTLGTFIYEFLFYIFYFALNNKLSLSFYMSRIIIPEVIYSSAVTLVAYIFIYYIIRKVTYKKKRRHVISV